MQTELGPLHHLSRLNYHRYLLWLWITREIRVRYKQSILGVFWAVVQPLAMTLVFTVVFSYLVNIDTGGVPYPIFAYVALVPWVFFASSLSFGIPSLVANMNLVTKIFFPREILPLASIGAAGLDFLISASILLVMMLFYGAWPGPTVFWVIPLLFIQIILTVGVVLTGSAIIVFFRDMRFVIPLMTQIWMYATPIIYPVDLVPEKLLPLYFLNPMAGIIDGYRRAVLMGQAPRTLAIIEATIVSFALLFFGYYFFKKVEPVFADLI